MELLHKKVEEVEGEKWKLSFSLPSISPSISPSVESLLSYFVDELARKRLLRKLRCSDLLSRLMAYLPSKTQLY